MELAGALAEIARDTLKIDFRSIDPAQTRVILVQRSDRLLKSYPPDLSTKAQEHWPRHLRAQPQTQTALSSTSLKSFATKAQELLLRQFRAQPEKPKAGNFQQAISSSMTSPRSSTVVVLRTPQRFAPLYSFTTKWFCTPASTSGRCPTGSPRHSTSPSGPTAGVRS